MFPPPFHKPSFSPPLSLWPQFPQNGAEGTGEGMCECYRLSARHVPRIMSGRFSQYYSQLPPCCFMCSWRGVRGCRGCSAQSPSGHLATDPTLLGDCGPVARFSFLLVTPSGQHRALPDLGRPGWIGALLFPSCSGNRRVCTAVRTESRKMIQPWRERRETKENPRPHGKRTGVR